MVSYRDGLKGSVAISLIQARLKMAYEANAMGFECPSWNVKAWEAKLRDFGGNPMEHNAKPMVEEHAKVAEKVVDTDADAGKNVGGDAGTDAGADAVEAMVEEGVVP
ncbi:hypothetical protein Hanom_Chr16g01481661 [Helianthus anomalus]